MVKAGILIFTDVEELDFAGPFEILSYINKIRPDSISVQIVAESHEPVVCFNGLGVLPHLSIDECPPLDILVVPGGKGRLKAMKNMSLRRFILSQNESTSYTASVCTGAFLLAEAGLLSGRRVTTYHTAFDELRAYGTDVVRRKVVRDGKIITSAGVSSGIELGLFLLKELFGDENATLVAEKIEYDTDLSRL
jgi:cyclohexyl-isocyanide hydratase